MSAADGAGIWQTGRVMKTSRTLLLFVGLALSGRAAEPTLEDIQKELTITKARLELAETKLALAAKEKELAQLTGGEDGEKPADPKDKNQDEAKALKKGAQDLWNAAVERLQALPPLQRETILGVNGISGEQWRELMARPVNPFTLADSSAAAGSKEEQLQRFLVRYGYNQARKGAALAKEEVAEAKTKAVDEYGSTGVTDIPVKSAEDVLLRNAGISFSQGFGVAFGPKDDGDASMGTLIARWNWLQRSAAGKWNRWVGQNNGEGYAQVPYRGRIEYWDGWGNYTDVMPRARRPHTLPEFTAFGPFVGSGAVGEKVKFGAATERPYLVGLTFGWGFLDEAASLLYVDLGVTVSPNSGFEHSKFFAGVSMDAIILSKVIGLTRQAKPAGD